MLVLFAFDVDFVRSLAVMIPAAGQIAPSRILNVGEFDIHLRYVLILMEFPTLQPPLVTSTTRTHPPSI